MLSVIFLAAIANRYFTVGTYHHLRQHGSIRSRAISIRCVVMGLIYGGNPQPYFGQVDPGLGDIDARGPLKELMI